MTDRIEAPTAEQLRILRHMLGINTPNDAKPKPYRDYYCAPSGDKALLELAEMGLVEMYRQDRQDWYTTTRKGRKLAMDSHASIRKTKAQRVYSTFLNVRDAFPDLTFRDFITEPQFADTRRAA